VYDKSNNKLSLFFENQGNVWIDGRVYTDLVNTQTGKKKTTWIILFFILCPKQKRDGYCSAYKIGERKIYSSVMIDYGDANNLEVGELNFNYD
jgi:hypothetical protein